MVPVVPLSKMAICSKALCTRFGLYFDTFANSTLGKVVFLVVLILGLVVFTASCILLFVGIGITVNDD